MRKIDIIAKKIEGLKPILKEQFKVESIGIFGSYTKGTQRKDSDIDILVEFEESADLSLLDFVRLENYLSQTLKLKVDLVEKTALKPRIGIHILEEVIRL